MKQRIKELLQFKEITSQNSYLFNYYTKWFHLYCLGDLTRCWLFYVHIGGIKSLIKGFFSIPKYAFTKEKL